MAGLKYEVVPRFSELSPFVVSLKRPDLSSPELERLAYRGLESVLVGIGKTKEDALAEFHDKCAKLVAKIYATVLSEPSGSNNG